MTDPVKIAFEQKVRRLAIATLLPTRMLPKGVKEGVKYRCIAASITEVGLIEPLSVARQKDGTFLVLDGHVRLDVLRELGANEVACVLASDDESFTYNKRVNRLATIQEHYMIANLVGRGISPDRLARALAVDVRAICLKRNLLVGINPDVVDLLKDKHVGQMTFQKLRKMKDLRQLEVAELMVAANNYTASYTKALLATSKPEDLHKPDDLRKSTGLSSEQMARLEREMSSLNADYKELENSYGEDMLVLVVASGFLERLLSKPEIGRFLETRHPEFSETFRTIVQASSLDQGSAAA